MANRTARRREAMRDYYQANKQVYSEKARARYLLERKNNPWASLLRSAKFRAKEKNLEFALTREDINCPDVCPYLGIPLYFPTEVRKGTGVAKDNTPSIDRVNPLRGYTRDNIEIISCLANRMKNKASIPHMVNFAKAVLERYGEMNG